jgi:hypothetical protein
MKPRFEFKFVIEASTLPQVREFARTHLELDAPCADKPGHVYLLHSIYLAPQSLSFWDWLEPRRNRDFTLRIRFYQDSQCNPVFLEITRSVANCILKQRCPIDKAGIPFVLAGHLPPENMICSDDGKARTLLQNFVNLVTKMSLQPKALVSSLREVHVGTDDELGRLTIYRGIKVTRRETCDFSTEMDFVYRPFGDKPVLALSFASRFPDWFSTMRQTFCLQRIGSRFP